MILGIFSYNGIEVIAVTSGETADPVRTIPAALRSMGIRLFLSCVLALIVLVAVVAWMHVRARTFAQSTFVTVFAQPGIREAAGLMNSVVITAALSSMNTNVHLCSRIPGFPFVQITGSRCCRRC